MFALQRKMVYWCKATNIGIQFWCLPKPRAWGLDPPCPPICPPLDLAYRGGGLWLPLTPLLNHLLPPTNSPPYCYWSEYNCKSTVQVIPFLKIWTVNSTYRTWTVCMNMEWVKCPCIRCQFVYQYLPDIH